MMNTDRYDLIDRYLDGVATPEEAQELLSAMAADPTMGHDVELSVVLRSLAQEESSKTTVPPALYENIVQQGIAAGVLAPAVTHAVSTAASSAAATGSGIVGSVSSFLSPLLITTISVVSLVGVGAGLYVTGLFDGDRPVPQPTAVVQQSTDYHGTAATSMMEGSDQEKLNVENYSTSSLETENSLSAGAGNTANINAVKNASASASTNTIASNSTNAHNIDADHSDAPVLATQAQLISANNEIVVPVYNELSIQPITNDVVVHETTQHWRHENDASSMLPIAARMYQRTFLSHSYETNSQASERENITVEAEVEIREGGFVGAGYHRDLFPLDVLQDDGTTQRADFMNWGSIHYRQLFNLPLAANLRPYAQLAVGGSSRGAAALPAVGVQWQQGIITMSGGVDLLLLGYQNNGLYQVAYSPSVRIEMGMIWK